ncbi:MAG: phosphoribosylanthranilate isomerase [Bacteroidales bacterium]
MKGTPSLKIKVCGLKFPRNIKSVIELEPDFIGFIFHESSPRHVLPDLDHQFIETLPASIIRTGVFVNREISMVLETVKRYSLNAVQLHGNELPEICRKLKSADLKVIKAFGIDENFDFNITSKYADVCDYFVFDTKTPVLGGSGRQYNWSLLEKYRGSIPFLLSGGIGPNDAKNIKNISHPALAGLDINSRFEIQPGLKDVPKLKDFINQIKNK